MTQNELSINGFSELSSNEMANIDGGIGLLAGAALVAGGLLVVYAVGYGAGYLYGALSE
jgi:lactobin A/cerein 7B family class IIb bacteriocin